MPIEESSRIAWGTRSRLPTVRIADAKVAAEGAAGKPAHALLHLLDVLLAPVPPREQARACRRHGSIQAMRATMRSRGSQSRTFK